MIHYSDIFQKRHRRITPQSAGEVYCSMSRWDTYSDSLPPDLADGDIIMMDALPINTILVRAVCKGMGFCSGAASGWLLRQNASNPHSPFEIMELDTGSPNYRNQKDCNKTSPYAPVGMNAVFVSDPLIPKVSMEKGSPDEYYIRVDTAVIKDTIYLQLFYRVLAAEDWI